MKIMRRRRYWRLLTRVPRRGGWARKGADAAESRPAVDPQPLTSFRHRHHHYHWYHCGNIHNQCNNHQNRESWMPQKISWPQPLCHHNFIRSFFFGLFHQTLLWFKEVECENNGAERHMRHLTQAVLSTQYCPSAPASSLDRFHHLFSAETHLKPQRTPSPQKNAFFLALHNSPRLVAGSVMLSFMMPVTSGQMSEVFRINHSDVWCQCREFFTNI